MQYLIRINLSMGRMVFVLVALDRYGFYYLHSEVSNQN